MEIDRYPHGVPSWIDIGSPDKAATAEFYGALFGWDAPEGPAEAGGYRVAMVGDRAVAGIGDQQNPGPPFWATYIAVDDADAVATKVSDAGGTVVLAPMDVLDVGRMAVFADPTGVFCSVWQAGTHPGAQLVNEPGTWSWSELLTSDPDAAKRFYAAVFGWEPQTHSGPMGDYTEWQVDGRSVGGMMLRPPMLPEQVPDHWAVYFSVADTDVAVARIAELGGTVVVPPMDIEPGRFAAVVDPTGAAFNVIAFSPERAGA
jgi:predicted enzyme related to lactoylglutathione lyase